MEGHEKRRYKRLAAGWLTRIRTIRISDSIRERLERAHNLSTGGVYIETLMPFERGALVEMVFSIPDVAENIHARGVVRWSNDGKMRDLPRGMGIEFLDVSAHLKKALDEYTQVLEAREAVAALTRTDLARGVLAFYCRKVGGTFQVREVAAQLGRGPEELAGALGELVGRRLALLTAEDVRFLAAGNPQLTREIQRWYEGLPRGTPPPDGVPG